MIREAIILAGGLGTRLQEVIHDMPKSMASVNGRPFLEYQLDYLERWSMQKVILAVGYKHEIIKERFGDHYRSMKLEYAVEKEPLGTGGGIINALIHVEGFYVFVFNGDTYFEVNLQRFDDFRRIKEADTCLVLRFENDTSRFGAIEFDKTNRIIRFVEKDESLGEGYINGGVYLLRKDYYLNYGFPEKFSIERDFFQKNYKIEEFYGLRCFSYFRDIGIPEDYKKAQDEFKRIVF
jgi:D-glycero-alpha-D-manno-heptose 1-phosphate guanylyltransferase